MIGIIIYSSTHFIHFQPKKSIFLVSNSKLTQILVNIYHMSFQRTFCVKLREQASMSQNGRFWSGIKWSVKQLLSRTKLLNDHLWKFDTENSVLSQFLLNGRNGITRAKFSGRCFTEAATFFKSYWKHFKDKNKFQYVQLIWQKWDLLDGVLEAFNGINTKYQ